MSLDNLAVVIAVKNGALTIEACVDSIKLLLAQGAKLYVYDSVSTDITKMIILAHCKDVRYICEQDGGLYYAWNRAIADVEEKYVFFINCDDVLYSTENFIRIFEDLHHHNVAVASSGQTIMVREDGVVRKAGSQINRDWFVGNMPILTPATIFRVEALKNIGGFDTSYKISSDYDMVLRLLARYGSKSFLYSPLIILRFSLGGMSNNFRKNAFAEIEIIVRRNLGEIKLLAHRFVCIKISIKRALLKFYFQARSMK